MSTAILIPKISKNDIIALKQSKKYEYYYWIRKSGRTI